MTDDLLGRRSMPVIVRAVMDALGGQAHISAIVQNVRRVATKDEWEYHADAAMTSEVRRALKSKDEAPGVPQFLSVGQLYKATRLFSVEDYEETMRSYAKASRQNRDKVYLLRDACLEAHGAAPDADAICDEFGVAV